MAVKRTDILLPIEQYINELVVIVESNGKIFSCNHAVELALGYKQEQLIDTPFIDLFYEGKEIFPKGFSEKKLIKLGGNESNLETVDHERTPVEVTVHKNKKQYVVIFEVITEKKRLEVQLAKTEHQLNHDLAQFNLTLRQLHQFSTQHFSSFEEAFHTFLKRGCELLVMETGIISEVVDKTYTIKGLVSSLDAFKEGDSLELKNTYCYHVIGSRKTVVYSHVGGEESLRGHPVYENLHLESYIGTPIYVDDNLYGTLNFTSKSIRKNKFSWHEVEIIEMMAASLGQLITQHKLHADLEREASHDALTKIPNKGLLLDRLAYTVATSDRIQSAFALIFLDVDNFKEINDTYGHAVGDKLLIAFAERLLQTVRKSDTAARYGGDEFVLVLTHFGTTANLLSVLSALNTTLNKAYTIDEHQITITVSMGVAIYPDDSQDIDALIQLADRNMYEVKSRGKNAFHLAQTKNESADHNE